MRKLLVLLFLLAALPSFAVTRNWMGAVSDKWSEPNNWSPAGVPTSADTLVFGSQGTPTMTNDLPAGTVFGPITATQPISITGNAMTLTGDVICVPGVYHASINASLTWAADATIGGFWTYNGTFDPNGHSIVVKGSDSFTTSTFIFSALNGRGTITLNGYGFYLPNNGSFAGPLNINGSAEIFGSLPNADVSITGSALSGNAHFGTLSSTAIVKPGQKVPNSANRTYGSFSTKNLSLGGEFQAKIQFDPTPASDSLAVTGTVTLSGNLTLLPGTAGVPPAPPGGQVTLIDNDGTDPVIGTFASLPEGTVFTAAGNNLQISYGGGDGNDVVLTNLGNARVWTGGCSGRILYWSQPCNWVPSGVPQPGEPLDFSQKYYSTVPNATNDFPGFRVARLSLGGPFTIDGNAISLEGDVSGDGQVIHIIAGADITFRGVSTVRHLEAGGHSITLNRPTFITELSGTGAIHNLDTLRVGSGTFSGTISGGTVGVLSVPQASVIGATNLVAYSAPLPAKTVLDRVAIDTGGSVAPGFTGPVSPGTPATGDSRIGSLICNTFSLAGTYYCDVNGDSPDQIIVKSAPVLSGSLVVNVVEGTPTAPALTLIDNQSGSPVIGSFSNYAEGATIALSISKYRITYKGGDGNDVVLNLVPEPSTVALTQNAATSRLDEYLILTATVGGTGDVVKFADNGVVFASVVQKNGVATYTRPFPENTIGSHTYSASWGTASASVTHTFTPAAMSLTVLAPSAAVPQGQPIRIDVDFQTLHSWPTGVYSVAVDGRAPFSVPVAGPSTTATTTVDLGALSTGSHSIAVHYAGDTNHLPADASTSVVVGPPPLSVVLTQSADRSVVGEPFTVRAAVTGSAAVVVFTEPRTGFRAEVPPQNGVATAAVNVTSTAGSLAYTATYGTASATVLHLVAKAKPLMVIVPPAAGIRAGTPATITATIGGVAGVAAPTGTASVAVADAATGASAASASAGLSGGTAAFLLPAMTEGAKRVVMTYGGDERYEEATISANLDVVKVTEAPVATSTTVSAPATAQSGKPIALTVAVRGVDTQAWVVGVVAWYADDVLGGSAQLSGGNATLSIAMLSPGTHVVSLKYLGSGIYLPSQTAVTIRVDAPAAAQPPHGRAARH